MSIETRCTNLNFPVVMCGIHFCAKSCLLVSPGNASVERGFTANKNMPTDGRCSMSPTNITSLRFVKDANRMAGGSVCEM